jgi:hypothetical protein
VVVVASGLRFGLAPVNCASVARSTTLRAPKPTLGADCDERAAVVRLCETARAASAAIDAGRGLGITPAYGRAGDAIGVTASGRAVGGA